MSWVVRTTKAPPFAKAMYLGRAQEVDGEGAWWYRSDDTRWHYFVFDTKEEAEEIANARHACHYETHIGYTREVEVIPIPEDMIVTIVTNEID